MHLKENTTLQGGRYRIIRTLGQGGFGITYLAEDTRFGETVAIKEFFIRQFCNRDEDTLHVSVGVKAMKEMVKEFYDKFFREAQKTRKLKHRNIIKITDLFPENGTAYYVMDYHPGGSLGSLIRKQGALNEEQALRYIRQVASALKLIHSNNMAHLDIKPDNILLDDEDNAIVIDFGISKHYDEKGNATTIIPGANAPFTPGYAADSQMDGDKVCLFSPTLDIYSLGATLYNLVTGKEPPISAVIINYGFPALPDRISSSTCNAIKKAMEPKSANRPQSVDEFLSVLDSRNATLPGRLFVTTSPAGATVIVDGKHIGNTPIERYELKKGVYTLKITKEGYNTISKNITISNDPAIINVALTTIEKQQVKNSKEKNNQSNKPTKQEIEKYYNDGVKAYNAGNYSEAVRFYRKAAEQGNSDAQNKLGNCYYYGTGVTEDETEAVKWYRKAAEQGNARAQYKLAHCYESGQGVTKDFNEAVKWYRKAAEQGYAHAKYNLGLCYEYGTGVTKDLNEAVKWYREAAEQGNEYAKAALLHLFPPLPAEKTSSDSNETNRAKEQKSAKAANINVALTTIDKQQVKNSKEKNNQSNKPTKQEIEKYYNDGVKAYNAGNYSEAVRLYRKAAEQGNSDAQYKLVNCYYYGTGVTEDETEAVKWYRKAAEEGNADAQYSLGHCYYNGEGVTKDYTEAVKWYRKAAEQGNENAQNNLGYCYFYGTGVTKDYTEAVKWYRKAAEQGNSDAQYYLGVCYYYGRGITEDETEAAEWYRKAAEQGNENAKAASLRLFPPLPAEKTSSDSNETNRATEQKSAKAANINVALTTIDKQQVKNSKEKDNQNNKPTKQEIEKYYNDGVKVYNVGNYTEAVKCFRKAAEQGYARAQNNLGYCYEKGQGVAKDETEAVKWYRKAAEQGNAAAQCNLGYCYEKGQGVAKDYTEAVKWYRKAVEQGDATAQNNLGYCYEKGQGVAEDYTEAVKWYRKAAEQGEVIAQYNLGECYYNGEGVAEDYTEAVKWYRKAAEQGYAHAQYRLALCYDNGRGVAKDYTEAVKWYRKAAEQGNARAQCNLGLCYKYGTGVTEDETEAVKWYRKAAEQGNVYAQYSLGVSYEYSTGVAKDLNEAVKWYRKAAEQGYVYAQYSLGCCYYNGEGVTKDYTEAVKWYHKAAEQGYAHAQYKLALCYDNGRGVTKDLNEAVKWYRKAAEQGYAHAKYNLGLCYEYGTGVTKDLNEAVKWYREAAEQGNAAAQCNLGYCYYNGEGVTKDLNEAVKWYRKAAEQGNAAAQCDLGVCYEDGQGVAKNYTEAVKWYRKAAEQGYAHAQYKLALCYEYGTGVTKDLNEAVKWYRRAAEQGEVIAQYNLGYCYKKGLGVTIDYTEAVKWYRKAAEQGNAAAQNNLGVCYYNGEGVAKNYTEAVKWYRKATEQGNDAAQCNLGYCYYNGEGVTKDYTEAVKCYRKAAEQGYAHAQYKLALCYEYGTGVTKNLNEAAEWYRKAAEQGNENAKAALLRLFPPLPAEKTSSDSNVTNRATEQNSAKAANVSRATQQMNKNGASRSTQQMNNPTVKNKQDRTANGSRGNEKARKSFNWKPLVGIIAAILCIIFAGVGINECNDYRAKQAREKARLAAIEQARIAAERRLNDSIAAVKHYNDSVAAAKRYNDSIAAEKARLAAIEKARLDSISKYYSPLRLACVKNDGSLHYFTAGEWEANSAKSSYNKLGVLLRANGREFIIAAKDCVTPQRTNDFKFGAYGVDIYGVKNHTGINVLENIWTGKEDTRAIINETKGKEDKDGVVGAPAAEAAWNYKACSNDPLQWYLPSVSELRLIYKYITKINKLLKQYFGGGEIEYGCNWSSTSYDEEGSWYFIMSNGYSIGSYGRNNSYRVRAVSVAK